MDRGLQGKYLIQQTPPEPFRAFVPHPLPPEPDIQITPSLQLTLSRADQMLGRLDEMSKILPSVDLLIFFYTRKEAVLSSQIEGTQTTLSEYLLFELDETTTTNLNDAGEVSNYIAAMNHGLARMRGNFPLSLRLLREMHTHLLRTGRGSEKTPGEFRRQQNWIGGTRPGNARFVPPPMTSLDDCLDAFEKFLHGDASKYPVLVQAALAHAQFETIHPFQDGNGRLGRMLVTLLMIERGVLTEPLLYMSLFLKNHKEEYYDHLQRVRMSGTWEEWIEFFIEGVRSTAEQAVALSHEILQMFQQHKESVQTMGSKSGSAWKVLEVMQRFPFLNTAEAAARSGLSLPTVIGSLEALRSKGLIDELTGKARGRFYVYRRYLDLLNRDS